MALGAVMAGAAFVKLTLDDASLQQGLNRAENKIKAFKASAEIALTELATVFTAINVPIIGAMRSFAAFDDQMRMVKAVTNATGKAFEDLTEQAKQLGRETSFTASEVAGGMLSLGRMGLNPDEISNAIRSMMDLARVTGTELGQAAEIAANNMRVFGLQAEDMEEIADLLSVTANSSAQTLADLGEALKMAGPHARRAGADLKDTAAALGILANMGIRGSMAGTALGKSYKKLADPKVIDYLKQYGVETLNADGSMRRMRDTLVDMAKAMKKMTNAQQITFAEKVFDARGSLGGGILAVNTDAIDEFVEKLDEAEGMAREKAEEMEAGIGGALRKLASAAEGVSLAFGEIVSISFLPLVEQLSNICLQMREIIKSGGPVIGTITKILYLSLAFATVAKVATIIWHAVKKLYAPLKAIWMAVGSVTKAVAALKVALAALLAHPIVATLAVATAALIAISYATSKAAKEMREYAEAQEKAADAATDVREKGDTQRQKAQAEFDRLKQLEEISEKGKLTAQEKAEAESIMKDLAAYGSEYWAELDTLSGKLSLAANAQDEFNKKMKEAAKLQIQSEIDALKAEKAAIDAETEGLQGYWHHNLLSQINGHQAEAVRQIEVNGQKSTAVYEKILAAQARLKALNAGDQNAVTGGPVTPITAAGGLIVPEDEEEAIDPEKIKENLKKLDDELIRSQRTNLQNKIADIQKLREEYKKNIDALIKQQKEELELARKRDDWREAGRIAGEIGGLEFDLDLAMKRYDQMEADARKDAAKGNKKYETFMDDMMKDAQDAALERDLEAMNKNKDYYGLESYLSVLIDAQTNALNNAVTDYNEKLAAFLGENSEGGAELVDTEEEVLKEIQRTIADAQNRIANYTDRLERAQDAIADANKLPDARIVGSWTLAALDQMFDVSAEDRTAKATETMVKQQEQQLANQKEMNRHLDKIEDQSTIVYG